VSDGYTSTAPAAPGPEARRTTDNADAEILEALSRGETRLALLLSVERHALGIGRLCMAMLGSQPDADDLTERTLLAAHERFAEFRGDGSLRAWLLGIARHECLSHLERSRRHAPKPSPLEDGEALLGKAPRPVVEERSESARALLEHVRPSDRDALLLRYGADLSFDEVAAASGIDEPTARRRVSRALLCLRSVLESQYDDD
jgi:RNA polymerase sigma-70 factor, ECF subfamily